MVLLSIVSQLLAVVIICIALAAAVVYEHIRAKRRKRSRFQDACRKLDKALEDDSRKDEQDIDGAAPFL